MSDEELHVGAPFFVRKTAGHGQAVNVLFLGELTQKSGVEAILGVLFWANEDPIEKT
jgi:hypothetical protein